MYGHPSLTAKMAETFNPGEADDATGTESVEAFLARGGRVTQVAAGATKADFNPLANCQCGCHGDWTDHSMRQGERGRV